MNHQATVPALLLSLIEDDKSQELQSHLCDDMRFPMQVSAHRLGFWQKQWPQLVRHAAEQVSEECLRLLLMLNPTEAKNPPPLPSLTLAWLLKGFEANAAPSAFSDLAPDVYEVVVARLSASPIALRTDDGLRLIRLGGPSVVFARPSSIDEDGGAGLFEAPAFQGAWRKWCASSSHRAQALQVFSAQQSFSTPRTTMQAIVEVLPAVTQASYLNELCDGLAKMDAAAVNDTKMVQVVMGWQGQFLRAGWALDHSFWKVWGNRLCGALERIPLTSAFPKSTVGASWTTATIQEMAQERSEPLPGWRWTPEMREGLVRNRGDMVGYVLSRHPQGQALSDPNLTRAGTFLRQVLQIETIMERWGLGDASTLRHMDTALQEVLGEDWEDRFDKILQEYRALSPTVHTQWAAWKARRLEMDWVAESAVPSGRPRM